MLEIKKQYQIGNFFDALAIIEQCLSLFGFDLELLLWKGKMLRMLKQNKEAREVFLMLFPYIENSRNLKVQVLIELIYLEIYEREYLTAYSYLCRLEKICDRNTTTLNLELASIYLKVQAGLKISISSTNKPHYFEEQILDYREERFLNRLFQNNGVNSHEDKARHFHPEVDLEKLFRQIKTNITKAKRASTYNLFDTYFFKYPFVGFNKMEDLHELQVLSFQNGEGVHLLEISPYSVQKYKNDVNALDESVRLGLIKKLNFFLHKGV